MSIGDGFLVQNRLLQTFLEDEDVNNFYLNYLKHPNKYKKDKIEELFQIHVRKIQLLTYFSKILNFEAKRYDRNIKQLYYDAPLILDKSTHEGCSGIDLVRENHSVYELDISIPTSSYNLAAVCEDKRLYKIISKLSTRQKEILYLLYIEGLTEYEIAQKLVISKQSVNKTKNQTLKKIKQDYERRSV
ncbi:sigma-70 family RNA polymerase sigma factor [Sporosarcina aquimarina]|uniref:sigma-70 family RNA polymerase sigma factor n=1 Tax=Sporosarcina aquimarina TaxID=114975 RepID=UPI00203ACC1A|nr:sigma-70 family RNA polymerase sigma factor [Sporosarcina aquimarina]MCM3759151.1 sigma-70 family RNA polymerase sigma factor [Sporosarcina aquimarina]